MSDRDRTDTREENRRARESADMGGISPEAGIDSRTPSATDRDQPSALGGHVATRSGTANRDSEGDESGGRGGSNGG